MSKSFKNNPALDFINTQIEGQQEVTPKGEYKTYKREDAPAPKASIGEQETKTRRVQLLLQPSVYTTTKELARLAGTSFNDYVNSLLRENAEREGKR